MATIGRIALGMTVVAVATILAVAPAEAQHRTAANRAIAARTARTIERILVSLAKRSGKRDHDYFANGVWHSGESGYWFDNVGAGTAAAVLWHTGGERDALLKKVAMRTFDTAIAAHRNPNGSLGPLDSGPEIETTSFGVQLGTAYMMLAPGLSSEQRSRWQSSLAGAADFLARNGNVTWYTNGNINLSQVQLFYLAWRATKDSRFKRYYEQAWRFTLNPPQDRWPGFGLHISGASFPTGLGSDPRQSGYLAESGGGEPGLDVDYTVLQLDAASAIYLFSGDPRARLLSSMLANTLVGRLDSNALLDTSGGTRHPKQNRVIPLLTSGLAILGMSHGHDDLGAPLPIQLHRVIASYKDALSHGYSPYLFRGLGTQISMILLAASPREGR